VFEPIFVPAHHRAATSGRAWPRAVLDAELALKLQRRELATVPA
jgi:hypothetical protein